MAEPIVNRQRVEPHRAALVRWEDGVGELGQSIVLAGRVSLPGTVPQNQAGGFQYYLGLITGLYARRGMVYAQGKS